jgi:hypothetical protein
VPPLTTSGMPSGAEDLISTNILAISSFGVDLIAICVWPIKTIELPESPTDAEKAAAKDNLKGSKGGPAGGGASDSGDGGCPDLSFLNAFLTLAEDPVNAPGKLLGTAVLAYLSDGAIICIATDFTREELTEYFDAGTRRLSSGADDDPCAAPDCIVSPLGNVHRVANIAPAFCFLSLLIVHTYARGDFEQRPRDRRPRTKPCTL